MIMRGPRVSLRQWTDHDTGPFAALNADPEVMEFFPQRLTLEQSLGLLSKLKRGIGERGWGLWAVEVNGEFAGCAGLTEPAFVVPFTPCVEIGWRFHRKFWGHGYAL